MKKLLTRNILIAALGTLVASGITAFAVNITGTFSAAENQVARVGYLRVSTTDSITAFSGGGQTSAVLLDSGYNRVTTVAAGNDSVKLPSCLSGASSTGMGNTLGLQVIATNAAASNSMDVYPQSGQSINAITADSPYAMVAGKTAMFVCGSAGKWYSILGG